MDGDEDSESKSKHQIHQEVLMSYRLLFAQSRTSRKLVKKDLRRLLREDTDGYDHLLDVLCLPVRDRAVSALPVSLWPATCRGYDGRLLEQSTYSSHDDFPLLGHRLSKLQDFCLRQEPSQLRDLWRDRRHPLQWYTFWAVLVVGGLSIILAILQLAVGVAQLAYGVRQVKQGNQ